MANSTPPSGAPKAADTPEATPTVMNCRRSAALRKEWPKPPNSQPRVFDLRSQMPAPPVIVPVSRGRASRGQTENRKGGPCTRI
jgi:hypothetical protein